jgi:hypothetical protein
MSDKPSEYEKRRDEILKRMLHMPPKHKTKRGPSKPDPRRKSGQKKGQYRNSSKAGG